MRKRLARELIDFLNDLREVDPMAIDSLFSIRVPCNEELNSMKFAWAPTTFDWDNNYPTIGIIGILNMFLEAHPPKSLWRDIETGEFGKGEVQMSNIVEDLKYIEWQLFNLHKSVFAGRKNAGRDRQIKDLLKRRSDINKIMYPPKNKRQEDMGAQLQCFYRRNLVFLDKTSTVVSYR